MSTENRSNSALFKRAEQLKRWEDSETNRESSTPKNKSKRIQFSLECVFLAACASGDKDEVLRLLNVEADIDTSNVDGLSALHQACIDDNLDMVEFLVKHGADINKGDNEGWTPLHATASCGFISIAKYLIEQGADVAAVNNDGELAIDIAESDEMEDLLQAVLKEKGIDPDEARNKEERIMLQHAKEWLNIGKFEDIPHEKTGATALHVAASKGYIKVMDILIQAGADVNAQDFDGWTPLHAAAHWGQKEACEILVENFCDMNKKNYVGQTAFDVSEGEMVRLLEDLRKKQSSLSKDRSDINALINKGTHSPKKRLSVNDKSILVKDKDATLERQSLGQLIMEEDTSPIDKVPKVELTIETERGRKCNISEENDKNARLTNNEKQNTLPETTNKVPINSVPSAQSPKSINEIEDTHVSSWRKPTSFRNAIRTPFITGFDDDKQWSNSISNDQVNVNNENKAPEVQLRRTQSFEADDKKALMHEDIKTPATLSQPSYSISSITNTQVPSTIQDTYVGTNATTVLHNSIRRSFVPPVRDEESETQRKAHAKRVRETRRSTQGVTLEEIKSAEQLVKKKQQQQQQQLQNISSQLNSSTPTNEQTFMLEDVRHNEKDAESANDNVSSNWSVTQNAINESIDTANVTLPLRKNRSSEDSEQVKIDKDKGLPNVQLANQRRKRPKRRSTGAVQFDNEEENDRLICETEINDITDNKSGSGDKSGSSSRLGSVGSLADDEYTSHTLISDSPNENGELDYKKLYEETLSENERLREKLKKTENELIDYKICLSDPSKNLINKNSVSELEKREKRAMERKLSEMEEELKQIEQVKQENQRLKDENGALIRVISKLSK
ncbi:hypothetical protein PGB90_005968 [Kerria lacca]